MYVFKTSSTEFDFCNKSHTIQKSCVLLDRTINTEALSLPSVRWLCRYGAIISYVVFQVTVLH